MPSSLGVYIEDNLIKYAKVSKNNNETIKVESFGVKFYENLETAIKQIIEETYSFKIPISINSTDEWYNEIQVFSLLTKKDMENTIKTEFENICYAKEVNKNIYEERYFFTNSYKGNDKIKAIHIAVPKTSIEQTQNQFSQYKINSIVPVSVSIADLIKKEKKGSVLIVNIENNTTITKVTNGMISDIEVLDIGAKEILDKINKKENSYSKSYEICKSSTIYTETDKDLQYEENEYLEDIMPTLFQIVSRVRKNIDENIEKIENVYITGIGAIINNIDIYFQDYLRNIHCEILKPSFISNNSKINIKDYIEVNSAIAIAINGLEKNNKNINFKSESGANKVISLLTSNVSDVGYSEITNMFSGFFSKFNRQLDFLSTIFILITILYCVGTFSINNLLDDKIQETDISINNTNARIKMIQEYEQKFDSQISKYKGLISAIQNLNNASSEDKRYKNTIPNLLNNIMAVIPKGVQLTSIENSSDTHIVIKAKSPELQQIAYFKTKLKTEDILKNVVSDTGKSENGYLIVTIEGELP